MEVEAAIRRRLLADPGVNGYVAGKVWKYRLPETLDGTGGRAIVVWRDGGWAQPDKVKTSEFPLVNVDCWADHSRDERGAMLSADAEENAWAVYRVVDMVLHGRLGEMWGELHVVTSARWGEPFVLGGRDPSVKAMQAASVRASYSLQVVH